MKFILAFVLFLFAFNFSEYAQMKKAFINGKVFTADRNNPSAEAVIITGNKITFTGSSEAAKELIDADTHVFNLKGKLMLPGFIDNHVHFTSGGTYLTGLNLRPAKSKSEMRTLLKEYISDKPGEWIIGGEWDHEAWDIKELPVKEDIDDITPLQPVFTTRFDGHLGLANSYALKLAGITKDTPSPEGGLIVKDPETGEPTGILKDNAMSLVTHLIPPDSYEVLYKKTIRALEEAARLGVTAVQDISSQSDLEIYKNIEADGKLTCRIYSRLPVSEYKDAIEIRKNYGSHKLKTGSLKAFADGSLGAMTAWFWQPYAQDSTTTGLPNDIITDGKLKEWALDADKNELQLSIHAIGDRANSYILNMYGEISRNNPHRDRRFRIEHAQHILPEDISKFAEFDVIASVQPYHAIDDGVWAEKRVGADRIKQMYPFRSFLDAGVKLCFGSDWVVAPLNPLTGIYAAVTRRTLDGKNPDGWVAEQKITVEEAIECYTINNAYASFDEERTGSIETGKLADLVILEEDILTIPPENIKDVKVHMTIFDGEVIYMAK